MQLKGKFHTTKRETLRENLEQWYRDNDSRENIMADFNDIGYLLLGHPVVEGNSGLAILHNFLASIAFPHTSDYPVTSRQLKPPIVSYSNSELAYTTDIMTVWSVLKGSLKLTFL